MPLRLMASQVKMLVTDLDGTLIYEHKDGGSRATDRTAEAIRKLQAKGVAVVFASGRIHQAMTHIADHMGVRGPIVSCNGAQIWHPDVKENGGMLFRQPLDLEIAKEVVLDCQERGLLLNYYLPEGIYAHRFTPYWDIYHGRTSAPMHSVDSLVPFLDRAPTKLLIFSDAKKIQKLKVEWEDRLGGRANVLVTADEYLEFMAPEVNKGKAVQLLLKHMNLKTSALAAAGDGHNDLEMIQLAGLSLAVSSGRQELIAAAHHVIAPPDQSGLAQFIEEYLLG